MLDLLQPFASIRNLEAANLVVATKPDYENEYLELVLSKGSSQMHNSGTPEWSRKDSPDLKRSIHKLIKLKGGLPRRAHLGDMVHLEHRGWQACE